MLDWIVLIEGSNLTLVLGLGPDLVCSSSAHPDVLADVRDAASKDPATRKLFVRGLAWETTTQQLRSVSSWSDFIVDLQLIANSGF
jgi:hypothetical protein